MSKGQDEQGNPLSWQAEDIKDYSPLTQAYAEGKLNGDQLAEGQTLLQNYLSDVQAQKDYAQAAASARNDARRAAANTNYTLTRLAGYLPELQANSGAKGYVGLEQGQQVALANSQLNAQQETEQTKQTALASALQSYNEALAANSKAAIDNQTSLAAARDQKEEDRRAEYQQQIDVFIENHRKTDEATQRQYLTAEDRQSLSDYIAGLDVSENTRTPLQNYLDLNYGEYVSNGENDTTSTVQMFNSYTSNLEKATTTADFRQRKDEIETAYKNGALTQAQYDQLKATVDEREKQMFSTSFRAADFGSAGGTASLNFSTKDGTFTDNNTTVTFRASSYTIGRKHKINNSFINSCSKGQAFIINDKVYVKGEYGRLFAVLDYAGNGAYEKLYNYLKGTCYDITDSSLKRNNQ